MEDRPRTREFFATYLVVHLLAFACAQIYQRQMGGWDAMGSMLFVYPLSSLIIGAVGCSVLAVNFERWQVQWPLLALFSAVAVCFGLPAVNILAVKLLS